MDHVEILSARLHHRRILGADVDECRAGSGDQDRLAGDVASEGECRLIDVDGISRHDREAGAVVEEQLRPAVEPQRAGAACQMEAVGCEPSAGRRRLTIEQRCRASIDDRGDVGPDRWPGLLRRWVRGLPHLAAEQEGRDGDRCGEAAPDRRPLPGGDALCMGRIGCVVLQGRQRVQAAVHVEIPHVESSGGGIRPQSLREAFYLLGRRGLVADRGKDLVEAGVIALFVHTASVPRSELCPTQSKSSRRTRSRLRNVVRRLTASRWAMSSGEIRSM